MKIDWNWSTEIVNPALLFFFVIFGPWRPTSLSTYILEKNAMWKVSSFVFYREKKKTSLEPQEGEEMMTGFQVNYPFKHKESNSAFNIS